MHSDKRRARVMSMLFRGKSADAVSFITREGGKVAFDRPQLVQLLQEQIHNHGSWLRNEDGVDYLYFELACLEGDHEGRYLLKVSDATTLEGFNLLKMPGTPPSPETGYVRFSAAEAHYPWLLERWLQCQEAEGFDESTLDDRLQGMRDLLASPADRNFFVCIHMHDASANVDSEPWPTDAHPTERCDIVTFLDGSQIWLTSDGPTLNSPFAEVPFNLEQMHAAFREASIGDWEPPADQMPN